MSRTLKVLSLAAAAFFLPPVSPANAVTLHYTGSSKANLQINIYSYEPNNYYTVGRGTSVGTTGNLDVFLDTDTNVLSVNGFFSTPGEYSIYSHNPSQNDSLKDMIGDSVLFSASKQLSNYTVDTNTGWFSFGGEPDSGSVWSNGFLGAGVGMHGIQSLNNIATLGQQSNPVLYGSFASILNNLSVEVLLGAELSFQGNWQCGVTMKPGSSSAAVTAVPEPMTILPLLLGVTALLTRRFRRTA